MIILKRIPVRRGKVEPASPSINVPNEPEVWCRRDNEMELLWHAALLQRLGFSSPGIRRILEKYAIRDEPNCSPEN